MKRFACSILITFAAIYLCACSKGAPPADQDSNQIANAAAEYTDAGQALADGIALLDTGETDRAIDVLNQAVKLNPDLAEAYFHLGIAYSLIEMRDATIVENDVNVDSAEAEKDRKKQKKNSEIAFERAVEGFKKIVAANKEDHAAWFNMGRAYNKLNEDKDALEAFEQAVELNPEDTEYQTELGAILIKLARYREAIAPLKKALELDPDNVEAQEFLEDAEAGRSRVSYSSTPKPDNRNSNSNANTANSNSSPANSANRPNPSNSVKTPTPRPSPARTPR